MGACARPDLAIRIRFRRRFAPDAILADPNEGMRWMNPHERPVVTEENKTAMRGGATGHNLRYVVIASLVLVMIAWVLVEVFVRR
jgi:hypothetical protein